jgi:hypothetical protein
MMEHAVRFLAAEQKEIGMLVETSLHQPEDQEILHQKSDQEDTSSGISRARIASSSTDQSPSP